MDRSEWLDFIYKLGQTVDTTIYDTKMVVPRWAYYQLACDLMTPEEKAVWEAEDRIHQFTATLIDPAAKRILKNDNYENLFKHVTAPIDPPVITVPPPPLYSDTHAVTTAIMRNYSPPPTLIAETGLPSQDGNRLDRYNVNRMMDYLKTTLDLDPPPKNKPGYDLINKDKSYLKHNTPKPNRKQKARNRRG